MDEMDMLGIGKQIADFLPPPLVSKHATLGEESLPPGYLQQRVAVLTPSLEQVGVWIVYYEALEDADDEWNEELVWSRVEYEDLRGYEVNGKAVSIYLQETKNGAFYEFHVGRKPIGWGLNCPFTTDDIKEVLVNIVLNGL